MNRIISAWIILVLSVICKTTKCYVHENSRIDEIERILKLQSLKLQQQNQRIQILEETVRMQQSEIDEFKRDFPSLKDKQYKISKDISVLKKIIMNSKMELRSQDLGLINHENAFNVNETSKIRKSKVQLDTGNDNVQRFLSPRSPDQLVAFYAYMSGLKKNPVANQTLVFDFVRSNFHGGYNGFVGKFTAPFTGVYIFTYTIRVTCHSDISIEIVKNGTAEGSVYIYTEDPNICEDDQTSGTTVTLAYQGDVVFIRTHETYKPRGSIQSNEYGHTSFAGWLIPGSASYM